MNAGLHPCVVEYCASLQLAGFNFPFTDRILWHSILPRCFVLPSRRAWRTVVAKGVASTVALEVAVVVTVETVAVAIGDVDVVAGGAVATRMRRNGCP